MRLQDLDRLFDSVRYPISREELIARFGTEQIEHPEGDESVSDVVARCGTDRFDSSDDLWLSMQGALGEGAIGRKSYSDRDPPVLGEADQVSF